MLDRQCALTMMIWMFHFQKLCSFLFICVLMIGRTTRAECSSYLYGGSLSLSDYLQVFYRILPTSLWRNSSDFCLSVTQVMVTANATWLHSIVLKILTDRIVIFTRLLEHLQEFPISGCHSYFIFFAKTEKIFSNSSSY